MKEGEEPPPRTRESSKRDGERKKPELTSPQAPVAEGRRAHETVT
jgi:hypothetical protein